LFLFSQQVSAQVELEEQLRCREIAFSVSVESRDAARFASFIDSDARFIGAEVLHGVDAVVAAWAPFFAEAGPRIRWRPQFVEVLEEGNLALTRGPYRMTTINESGETREQWGTFNSVWRRKPGEAWQVVFDAGSAASAPPAEQVRALLEQDTGC
jgi:ketosteroid isomerase-like protein